MVVAICPRAEQGLHDQRVKTLRDSYQPREHERATSLRPVKQRLQQVHLITSRPAAGKVKQGAAECVDPGYGRESEPRGAETGSLPLAPRSRQTCASLPHRVSHRCPWKARQKDALRAENTTQSNRNNAYAHPHCGERAGGEGVRENAINANLPLMSRSSPSGCSRVLLLLRL